MHSADGHAYISTGVKKHFMFLEELNRTICENGLNFRLLCIYFFKSISQLPGHLINTAYFAFFLDFLHLFSDSDHFFRDPYSLLHFSQLQHLLFTIS